MAQDRFKIYSVFSFIFISTISTITCILMLILILAIRKVIGSELISNTTLNHTEAVVWFLIPTIGAALTGVFFITNIGTTLDSFLVLSITYFTTAGMYLVATFVALFITHSSARSSNEVRMKLGLIVFFIVMGVFCTVVAIVTMIYGSIYWATEDSLDASARTSLACKFDYSNSCSGCPSSCPEWTEDEVEQVLRSAFKVAVLLGALLILFGLCTTWTGIRWQKHYRHHKVEYV